SLQILLQRSALKSISFLCGFSRVISTFFFSSRRRHTRSKRDWSSDVCSSDLSRLLAEFHRQLSPGRTTWVEGRCVSYGTAIPYRSEERRVGKECRSRWERDQ